MGSGPFPLKFVRYYNSRNFDNSPTAHIGVNWSHSYHRTLLFDPTFLNVVTAQRGDGKLIAFNLSNSVYVADSTTSETLAQTANGWTLTNTQDEIEAYDVSGRLISITNRQGLTQTLTYDANGNLTSVADPVGRTLSFTNDSFSRTKSIAIPGGGTISYSYVDPANNLVAVTYPNTTRLTFQYESTQFPSSLTGITDENNSRFATFAYDTTGSTKALLNSSQHAGGADSYTFVNSVATGTRSVSVTRFVSPTLSSTNSYTFVSTLAVASNTAVTGSVCPGCGPTATTLDANGNPASMIDWNGNRTNYTYDLTRNLEIQRVEGLTAAGATTPQTRTINTQLHPTFRLPIKVAEPLRITTYVYSGDGGANCGFKSDGVTLVPGVLCSKTVQATTDSNGSAGFSATPTGTPRTWSYTYNQNGLPLTVDGPRTDVSDVTTYTYYADDDADLGKRGNVATIANAAGQVTSIGAYNAHGQPLSIVDPNGLTTTLTYDPRQRLTSRSVGGETTTYTYDNVGQLTKVTLPDSSFLSYSYDAAHRLTGLQDNLGNHIAYTLDSAGNRTQEQVFDPGNNLAQTRSRVYSNLNRLTQELGAQGQTTAYGYDNQGNVTSVTDPLTHVTGNQYDALNRVAQVTDPNLGVTQYAYNGLDALAQVTDPRSLVTGYTVDGLGNLNQQVSPDTGTTADTYDTAGNLLTQTDAKGQVTTYTYDALNRVTSITFNDSSKQIYAYDQGTNGLGRLSSITETDPSSNVTSVIAYAYDQHGRVISETRTVAGVQYVLGYTYDSFGRLTGLTYPSSRSVTYGFDALGRVNQVTTTKGNQSQVVVQNVAYQPFGGVTSFTLGNGQIYSRSIDQDGRIASYTLGVTTVPIAYDAASRITGIGANTYGYDTLDRLSSAVLPASSFGYSYDAVGNRLTKTTGANADTYTYSATSNQIASLTPAGSPTRNFVFDANGSTTNDGVNAYAYDTRGRMAQATSTAGTTTYQVNALGQRVRKTNSTTDTVFHYDTRGRLIAETDPGGTVKREYIYLGDIPVGVVQ